ncbi:hypothetical protein ACWCXH_24695 [Kitasatospora sp. NPDC001660]
MRMSTVTAVTVVSAVDAVGSRKRENSFVVVECLHHEDRVLPEKAMDLPLVLVAGLSGIINVQKR